MVGEFDQHCVPRFWRIPLEPCHRARITVVNEQLRNGDEWGKRKGDISCFFGWVAGGGWWRLLTWSCCFRNQKHGVCWGCCVWKWLLVRRVRSICTNDRQTLVDVISLIVCDQFISIYTFLYTYIQTISLSIQPVSHENSIKHLPSLFIIIPFKGKKLQNQKRAEPRSQEVNV